MSLVLHLHPLASCCHKVLIALYEHDTPFEARIVDFADPASHADLTALWPVGRIPVLHDDASGRTIPESSVIIEYVEAHHPGGRSLLPEDAERRLEARLWDRFFDLYARRRCRVRHRRLRGRAGALLRRHRPPLPGRAWAASRRCERLLARPSFRRVLDEARPYFPYFPYRDAMPARFLC